MSENRLISHGSTGATYGTWWLSTDDGERAEGTWSDGTWDICENTTPLTEDEINDILDCPDFWQGDTGETEYNVGEWDGEILVNIS